MAKVFVGHDWAEAHHDVFVEDGTGQKLGAARLPEGIEGVRRFHQLVAEHVEDPGEVLVATETDRGLFVTALLAAGYEVIAVNPLSTARYRERFSTSGAKSDPGDARILAELARVDGHNHRRIAGDTDLAEAIKVLARAHQTMIWTRTRHTNHIRSTLREFYPAALDAFDDLASDDALAVLTIAPTPTLGRQLSRAKIASALRRGGRQRRIDERAVEIQAALRAEHLQAPPLVVGAMGASIAALVAVTVELVAQIDRLEQELADRFEQHPDAKIIRSLPGLGLPGRGLR
jgi:transposase